MTSSHNNLLLDLKASLVLGLIKKKNNLLNVATHDVF